VGARRDYDNCYAYATLRETVQNVGVLRSAWWGNRGAG
jgi:hypothetical protein